MQLMIFRRGLWSFFLLVAGLLPIGVTCAGIVTIDPQAVYPKVLSGRAANYCTLNMPARA